ncbi:hypothetical protein LSAT2_018023 [Lamellibrachia satsuma]|nr:hypothetical protein LSAT2_018023 [Lamellibrachia satsuma]
MTYSTTTSSANLDMDFTTLATEFRNESYNNEITTDVGNATSLGRGMQSPNFYLITTLATIGIAGVLSNVAVLAVLFKKENRKRAANLFIINIAISDILMSCFVSEKIIAWLHIDIWSATDCRIYVIACYLSLYLGINSIMLVAVERFVAIVLPMRFRAFVAPGMVKLQLTFVWLLTFVELIFPWYYTKKVFAFGGLHSCTLFYNLNHYFYMSLTAIILPAVLLLILYGSIVGVVIHRQRKVNASIPPDPAGGVASFLSTTKKEQAARRHRRAIRLAVICAVVTILFLVFWVPAWILSFLSVFRVARISTTIFDWSTVIIYLHSCMNPCVYFIADDRFRSVFLRLVFRKDNEVGVSVPTPPVENNTNPVM